LAAERPKNRAGERREEKVEQRRENSPLSPRSCGLLSTLSSPAPALRPPLPHRLCHIHSPSFCVPARPPVPDQHSTIVALLVEPLQTQFHIQRLHVVECADISSIVMSWGLEFLACAVVKQRPGIRFVTESTEDHAGRPPPATRRQNAVRVKPLSDPVFRISN